jgi:PAS domain S-box-containing protein
MGGATPSNSSVTRVSFDPAPLSDVDDFRRLVDLAPDAIVVVDCTGHVVLVNARTEAMFGYAREELRGRPVAVLIPAAFRDLHAREFERFVQAPTVRPLGAGLDLAGVRNDGTQFPADISLSALPTAAGLLVIAVIRDISERKRVAEALKESRAWLEAILQASRDGIVVEEDEHISYANHAFAQLYGYDDPAELLGKHLSVVQATESDAWMLDLGRRRVAGEAVPWLYEFRGRRKDGTEIDLEASVSLLRTGGKVRIMTVVRDISERKRMEQERARLLEERAARREAEAAQRRWAFLAEAGAILSSSLDYETTLASVARLAVPTLADWCSVDIVGDDGEIHALAIAHRDTEMMKAAEEMQRRYPASMEDPFGVARAIRTGQPELYGAVPDEVLVGMARDGTHLRILREAGVRSAMIVPLVGRGRTLGAISLVATETERHFDATDLLFAEELAGRAALAIDNARLYREAQEASQLKDEFLATLSHELRTPLNAMLGWARLLRDGDLDPETAGKAVESIERNTQAQAQLVSDILDVSRIITGKLRINPRPLDPTPVVDAALDAVRPAAEAKGVSVHASLDRDVRFSADGERLLQITWNLLSNAVKFTPSGGRVDVRMGPAARGEIEIEVADTGVGISKEFLPYVFDRFRQGDPSTTRHHGGLGLGLAIVRHLVELHGGTVAAESAGPNQGSRFTVRLPAGTPVPTQVPSAHGTREHDLVRHVHRSLRDVRVLVVDDEPDTCELVRMTLKQYGATVSTASSAAEAVEMFAGLQPAVLVADIGMPGEDGYALVQRLRQLPAERGGNVPAIALTAYARPQDKQQALQAGFDLHLTKPIEPSELAWAVVSLLRKAAG